MAKEGFKLNEQQKKQLEHVLYAGERTAHQILTKLAFFPYIWLINRGSVDEKAKTKQAINTEMGQFLTSVLGTAFNTAYDGKITYVAMIADSSQTQLPQYLIELKAPTLQKPRKALTKAENAKYDAMRKAVRDVTPHSMQINSTLDNITLETEYSSLYFRDKTSPLKTHPFAIVIPAMFCNYTVAGLFLLPSIGMGGYVLALYLQSQLPANLLGWDVMQATISVGGIGLAFLIGAFILHGVTYYQMSHKYYDNYDIALNERVADVENFINKVYQAMDQALVEAGSQTKIHSPCLSAEIRSFTKIEGLIPDAQRAEAKAKWQGAVTLSSQQPQQQIQ
ncbi:MAG: hypothetical protein JSS50_00210 [Proteobacteria bacterium]|nr:hypothetical protein [Pseudomonadota bacterium]